MFFVLCLFTILVVSHFGFEGGNVVLFTGQYLPFSNLKNLFKIIFGC